jgi:hypothetical protein
MVCIYHVPTLEFVALRDGCIVCGRCAAAMVMGIGVVGDRESVSFNALRRVVGGDGLRAQVN